MRFGPPPRRTRSESIVPMINVVFLLLIFFLMTAQIAPPEPFEVLLPEAEREAEAKGETTLYLSGDGVVAYGDLRGEAAVAAAARDARADGRASLDLRADAGVLGGDLARLLSALAEAGVAQVALVTAGR